MPLPHFLMLLVVVIAAAAATLWVASSAGVPLAALALAAVVGAALIRLLARVE
ncbi:hypothetical protein [Phaeovulum sp.]|jgi:hypothetical protein|uniref:hypothetical protein n=1 Tax=Phaeovulum sp. TaxID=2934796 RepID=UPI002731383A|nr:hypothetical protein [Phaeovulum sp.]MDP1667812.1 hypothetical protein [Phaeovulum sp.]MDP2062680.1 hypothetical protein [Phaeovulum sp.]MDP3860818.1 hypothetical protein [Phaeovulum sp.]MDZ4118956.1 hypothetical protein [Phaeovulum sp.]